MSPRHAPSCPTVLRRLLATLALLLAPSPLAATVADAAVFTVAPGPEGQDVSYYSFVPLLNRGQYVTMYAHTSQDEQGVNHDAETFVRFDLPPGLLGPGETVVSAQLLMVFSFTFDHGGSPPPPGGELSVSEVLEDWHEDTLTYAAHPAAGPTLQTVTDIDAFGTITFDVTNTVAIWAHDLRPNYGFKLTNPNEDPLGFHSFEAAVDPSLKARLVIITGPGGPPHEVPGLGGAGLALLAGSLAAAGGLAARRSRRA